jgi:hypothetical protein
MEISLPINLLTFEETQEKRDSAYDQVAKYVDIGYITPKPTAALRVDMTDLKRQHTVRDASPATEDARGFRPRKPVLSASYVYCRFCSDEIPVNGDLCGHLERCGCGNIQFTHRGVVACKMSKAHPTDSDFAYCCPSSDITSIPSSAEPSATNASSGVTVDTEIPSMVSGRKVQYPSMKKIPEDLPCHERYTALSRSRSTRALVSQKVWTEDSGAGYEGAEVNDGQQCASDASSVYSQEEHPERQTGKI